MCDIRPHRQRRLFLRAECLAPARSSMSAFPPIRAPTCPSVRDRVMMAPHYRLQPQPVESRSAGASPGRAAREIFASRVPFFGSCWGLQVAAVAAGGTVRLNPKGREMGNRAENHLDRGRTRASDAMRTAVAFDGRPCIPMKSAFRRRDHRPPPPCRYRVQAAEIRHEGGIFWGGNITLIFLHDIAATISALWRAPDR